MASLNTQPDFIADLNILPTPNLNLTNQDIVQLFNDEQIMNDVAESYRATKIDYSNREIFLHFSNAFCDATRPIIHAIQRSFVDKFLFVIQQY
uniref:Uncharacterized protein n=1 Tax=Romanomermis culicivorax TaxID=13658 RepID=A0A915JVU0_ROMCU